MLILLSGLIAFAAAFAFLLFWGNSPVISLLWAAFLGFVVALVGSPAMVWLFHHPPVGGICYGIVMAVIAGWRLRYAPLGVIIIGVAAGGLGFILLCVSSGVLHH